MIKAISKLLLKLRIALGLIEPRKVWDWEYSLYPESHENYFVYKVYGLTQDEFFRDVDFVQRMQGVGESLIFKRVKDSCHIHYPHGKTMGEQYLTS
tara:strand:+ start:38 stop:325 length:288 start_codon:yes stop_codon:yes gene_type:complete